MNKIYFIFTLSVLLLLGACTEKELDPVLKIGAAPAITSPSGGTSFVLLEDEEDQVLTNFTWSIADFGFISAVSYTLEIDQAGNNFADAITLGVANNPIIDDITVGKVNSIMISKGLPDGVATSMEIRIRGDVGSEVQEVVSAPIAVSITPYKQLVVYPVLYVPGSYQGWDPANPATIVSSVKSDGNYEGYLYFVDANVNYKYADGPSWDVNYGDTGADGTLDQNGDDIAVVDAGMYRMNVDFNNLMHTAVKTDWGLIGDATPTGWDSDTDLVYDTESGTLKLTVDLGTGAIKFRANDDWDINMGDTDGNGSLEYGGDDIIISEAGNYTVELILNIADYTYKLTKN